MNALRAIRPGWRASLWLVGFAARLAFVLVVLAVAATIGRILMAQEIGVAALVIFAALLLVGRMLSPLPTSWLLIYWLSREEAGR